MDRAEFEDLLLLLRRQLRESGAEDVLDSVVDTEEGAPRDPKQLLISLLENFEQSLALSDRSTYRQVMANLRELPAAGRPTSVVLTLDEEEAQILGRAEQFNFEELPDLAGLRSELSRFVGQLIETSYDSGTEPVF